MPGPSFSILYSLLLPLSAALLAVLIRRPNLREGISLMLAAFLLISNINIMSLASRGLLPELVLARPLPGITLAFNIDPLGVLFALVSSALWLVSLIYCIGYMRGNKEARQAQFYAFFAIAIFAATGIAYAGNLFTLFLFYEILTLSTFPLVAHHKTEEAKRGATVYLAILLGTSLLLLLPAILWVWSAAGTTDFAPGGGIIRNTSLTPPQIGVLLALFAFGIGKAASMPFHRWLPAAMVAPTPVSALLHAVAVVKAGLFTLIKVVVYVFGLDTLSGLLPQGLFPVGWLMWLGAATMILASLVALRQDNLKSLLAYSTISQLAYVVMACGLFTAQAMTGAVFQIAAHAVAKITLFFAAGAIYTASKKKNVSELSGIARRMPWTMAAFAVGALSMIGLPPAAGFVTKFHLMQGAFASSPAMAFVLVASTLLNAAYFLPILFQAYFGREKANAKEHGEAPLACRIALGITAALTVLLFIYPDFVLWIGELTAGGI